MNSKLFEKILLSRILYEVSGRSYTTMSILGSDTTQQYAKAQTRNFDLKRLKGVVLLDVAKAFNTVWVDGLLYKFTVLKFPSYLVKILSSYLNSLTFEASFKTATPTSSRMRADVAQVGIISTCPVPSVCTVQ
jgi:hypothetical protein